MSAHLTVWPGVDVQMDVHTEYDMVRLKEKCRNSLMDLERTIDQIINNIEAEAMSQNAYVHENSLQRYIDPGAPLHELILIYLGLLKIRFRPVLALTIHR